MARRSAPEVNAGSMADIAFLLLIFFLVTTTMEKDKGISRQLPPIQIDQPDINIKARNLFVVLVNKNDDLLVEDDPMKLEDLRQAAIDFLDNGGAPSSDALLYCNYCKGEKDPFSSDNPDKAIISVKNDRLTSYNMYIAVQNELVGAYNFLRDRESQRIYGWKYTQVKAQVDAGTYIGDRKKTEEQLKEIQNMYPLKLSEASPDKLGK